MKMAMRGNMNSRKLTFDVGIKMANLDTIYDGMIHDRNMLRSKIRGCDFKCLRCSKNTAFICPDATTGEYFLSCIEEDCIQYNAGKTVRRPVFAQLTLSQCGVDEEHQNAYLKDCNQPPVILQALDIMARRPSGFLLLSGGSGLGKTYAACAAMESYLKHSRDAFFIRQSELNQQWLECKAEGYGELGLIKKLQERELLILDDLGSRKPTEAFLDVLYFILDKRKTNSNLGTIITTNLDVNQIAKDLGTPILSRLNSGKCFQCFGEDRRKSPIA